MSLIWKIFIGLLILVILAGIGITIAFFVRIPHPPPPPHPPLCLIVKGQCDSQKLCRQYIDSCTGVVKNCISDVQCQAKYSFPVNAKGKLMNGSTSQQTVNLLIPNLSTENYPAVMVAPSYQPPYFDIQLGRDDTNIIAYLTIKNTQKTVEVYLSGSSGFLHFTPSKNSIFQYNQITGQIVDNLENPTKQISLGTNTINGQQYQQLFIIPYATPTAREIWFLTK